MEELNKKFLAFTAGILLISSARVFVSGAYSSMELLSFYGELFPSFFGVLVFFIATALIGRINYKMAGILISLYAITGLLTDNTRYIHFLAGITLIIALSLIGEFLKEYFPYIVSGFIFDVILRVLALGGEPLDFPATRVLITFLFLITGVLLLKREGKLMAPSFKLYAFIALFELGLAYPNAILRYAGFKVYYLREFIITAVLLSLALAWGVILCEKINERALAILITLLSFAVFIGGIPEVVALLIMASLIVAALPSKNVSNNHSFFGALYFFAIAVLAVTTYAGVYIGLPFMQEKLEFVIVFASLVYALSVFKSFERINISNKNPVALFITALILVSVVVSSTYFPTPSCSETNNEFVIWSYNVHQGFTIHGAFNGHDLAKLIAENSPAIVAMQEVDGGRITSAYQDIPVIISAYTGMCYAYQPAIENTYGVAVFSVYPILSSEGYLLESIGEQRASIKATLKIDDKSLTLISVHLGLTPEERLMQVDELLKFSLKDPQAQIVGGDFNAEVDEESIKKMLLYYNDSLQKRPEYTWRWKEEKESIDYVFIKKDAKLEIKSAGILETLVSDHIPVWVRIKLFWILATFKFFFE